MNSSLDILLLRRPHLRYVSPGVCEASFSGSGAPIIVLDAFGRLLGPTGLIFGGAGGFVLSWNNYPGALCFSVYKAVDELNPFGAYVLIAECITDNFIDLDSFGPGVYRVTALTEEGESEPSEPITRPEGAGSVVLSVLASPNSTCPDDDIPGKFVITKEGFHATDLTVNFVISGTAENGVDYTLIASTAVIPSGFNSVEILVEALTEANDPESPETVILTLASGGFYTIGSPAAATVTIQQCQTVFAFSSPDTACPFDSADGAFVLFRLGGTNEADLTVDYTVAGTAVPGVDYEPIAFSAVILAGEDFVNVPIVAIPNAPSANVTVILTVIDGGAYTATDPVEATITVIDCGFCGTPPQCSEIILDGGEFVSCNDDFTPGENPFVVGTAAASEGTVQICGGPSGCSFEIEVRVNGNVAPGPPVSGRAASFTVDGVPITLVTQSDDLVDGTVNIVLDVYECKTIHYTVGAFAASTWSIRANVS